MNEGGSGGQPNPELGVPVIPSSGESFTEHAREQPPAYQETFGSKPLTPPSAVPSLPPPPVVHLQQPPVADQPVVQASTGIVNTSSLSAADQDHIEKQWIDAAKTVAAKTRSDPYTQKNEMSKVKADYIHKRFKKVVKTDDTVAA